MKFYTLAATAIFIASPVLAHHSDAGINMDAITAFEGTVTEYNWRNPHVYLLVETTDESGEAVEWEIQNGGREPLHAKGVGE